MKRVTVSLLGLLAIVMMILGALLVFMSNVPATVVEPAAPTGVVVLRDDAPAWCLDPSYPRGDMWYESCAEPVR